MTSVQTDQQREVAALLVEALNLDIAADTIDPAAPLYGEGLGLDYVSCSPYRVPIARLAAAQAALKRAK